MAIFKKIKEKFKSKFSKAREDGKKTFKGDFSKSVSGGPGQVTAGKLEYSTKTKKEVADKIKKDKKRSGQRPNDPRPAPKYEKATGTKVSARGQAFAKARKEGKDSFTFNGKSYSTRLKGEKRPATPEIKNQSAKKSSNKRSFAKDGGRMKFSSGGLALRGYGKAFKNGGRS